MKSNREVKERKITDKQIKELARQFGVEPLRMRGRLLQEGYKLSKSN